MKYTMYRNNELILGRILAKISNNSCLCVKKIYEYFFVWCNVSSIRVSM